MEEKFLSSDLQSLTSKADACNDAAQDGWIAPDGEWFGTNYAQHDYIARTVLGCSVQRLEQLGFCRCHEGLFWRQGSDFDTKPRLKLTTKQKKTLTAKGYDPKRD